MARPAPQRPRAAPGPLAGGPRDADAGPVDTDISDLTEARLGRAAALVPAGERIELVIGPSGWIVALRGAAPVVVIFVLSAGVAVTAAAAGLGGLALWALIAGSALLVGVLVWRVLDWWLRRYVLTDRRLVTVQGVLRTSAVDLPLSRVQHLHLERSLAQRVVGVGTIGVATAGSAGVEAVLESVDEPERVLGLIRAATQRAGAPGTPATPGASSAPPSARGAEAGSEPARATMPVLGLAGTIGAGKSSLARAFASLGCLVVDSDKEAHAALRRDDVRAEIVSWWGAGVLGEDGHVDRTKVARVVFSDPAQRARLEGLIHPLVKRARAELVAQGAARGVPAVIVDAPLLFEAGVDKECDAVVFVDAPREVRLQRVAARGWSEDELRRRESAQWPAERKRALCRYHVMNDDAESKLAPQAADILRDARARLDDTPPRPERSANDSVQAGS